MSKKYTLAVALYTEDVRSLCISHNWYTRGDNEEYYRLMEKCTGLLLLPAIAEIARDILTHSDLEDNEENFEEVLQCLVLSGTPMVSISE